MNVDWPERGEKTCQEDDIANPSRWNEEKRYQILKEALSQKDPWDKSLDGIMSLKGCSIDGGRNSLTAVKRHSRARSKT